MEEKEKEKDKIDKAKLNKRVKIITMMRERIGLWTKKEGSEEKEKTMVKTKNREKNRKIEEEIKKKYVNKGDIKNLSKETKRREK